MDIGVGIVADTANWTVKYHAVTKSLQTNDVLVGSADGHASRAVRQMLASVKHMHAMDMPPDFVSSICNLEVCVYSKCVAAPFYEIVFCFIFYNGILLPFID